MTLGAIVRDVSQAELGVPLRALRYVRSGFRAAPPPGAFGYDDGGNTPLLLGALAVLAIPEMLVLEFVLWHAPAWRIASDVLHVYAILWALGLAQAFRTLPHVVRDGRATLRTIFFAEVSFTLTDIESVETVTLERRAARRKPRFGIGKPARWVRVRLREPVRMTSWLAPPRAVGTFLVAADDPAALARALSA